MSFYYLSLLLCLLFGGLEILGYKVHTALNSIVFTNIPMADENVHSEYFYGKCTSRSRELMSHDHYGYEDVVGKGLIVGFIENSTKPPNCVYIRASSPYGSMVRYNAYKFTVCLGSLSYYYMFEFYYHSFFEWYLPVEMQEGIDWDLFFYRS